MEEKNLLYLDILVQSLPVSATLAINELVTQKEESEKQKVLHMGFGEASMPLHPLMRTALINASSYTNYAPVLGIIELRKAIAEYLTKTRGVTYRAEQIVVGPGSKILIYTLFQLLEGDILIPTPSWVSYSPMARLGRKKIVPVKTESSDHHRLTKKTLTQALSDAQKKGINPRMLIINSPNNPTGCMFSAEDIVMMTDWARENGITIISDEIYAELSFGWRKHVSPVSYYPEGTIVTGGISKTFSAGGWRIGYVAFPATKTGEQAIQAIRAFGSEMWSSTATPIQKAAVMAYRRDKSMELYIKKSARAFGYVTEQLYTVFQKLEIPCPRPAGGFYLYPDFAPWRAELLKKRVETSEDLAHYLLKEWNIATLPASAFNEDPKELRLRLSTSSLCEPGRFDSPQEREDALWDILDHIGEKNFIPTLPLLTMAKERWTNVIHSLRKNKKH